VILNRLVTVIFCLFVAAPLLWLLYAAFLPPEAILLANLTPTGVTLANFADLMGTGIWRAMGVSLLATGLTVLGQLVFGLSAAYAIRAGVPVLGFVLFVLVLPLELLLVPLYRQLQLLNLLDTLWVLVVPFLASPLVIFLLLQSLRRLPWEFVESARLDGATELTIVARIIAPLLRPELAATAVLAFAAHWNLVLYPRVMASERDLWTVQVFLTELLRSRPLDWGLLGAAAFVSTMPIFILYLLFEKRIVAVFESSFK
jgi:multiple sugar transport system permease protein